MLIIFKHAVKALYMSILVEILLSDKKKALH